MDELQEEVLIMYQEVRFLPKESLPYVLEKEFQMVGMFENILEQCTENGTFTLNKKEIQLLAHNIFIQGQMWGFRRWALQKLYTLEEYTDMQIRYVLQRGPYASEIRNVYYPIKVSVFFVAYLCDFCL